MSKLNFPQMFGSVLQFNMTQMFQVLAEQEVEKAQLTELINGLVKGNVDLSQLEVSQDGIRVTPKQAGPVDLSAFSVEDLSAALGAALQASLPEEDTGGGFVDVDTIAPTTLEEDEAPPMENENFDKAE